MGERQRALGRGQPPPRVGVRDPGARDLPGTAAVRGARSALLGLLPALLAVTARLAGSAGPAGAFRAAVLGLAATGLVGAFARAGVVVAFARIALASVGVALAVAWGGHGGADGAARLAAAAALAFASGAAPFGLASLGRALRCPDPGAGVVAFLVLLAGLVSLAWVDSAAQQVGAEARFALRQAVLRSDLATAAAYDAAGYDRLHEPEVYDTTTIASLPVELPRALPAAASWTAAGAGAAAMGAFVSAVRRRRASRVRVETGASS